MLCSVRSNHSAPSLSRELLLLMLLLLILVMVLVLVLLLILLLLLVLPIDTVLEDPFQYRATVGIFRNYIEERLTSILTSNQIITVSVAGATQGHPLTKSKLRSIDAVCLYLNEFSVMRTDLSTFVE